MMTTRSTAKSTSGEPGNVPNQVHGQTVTLENGEEADNRNASEIRKVLEDDSVSVNDLQLLASSLEMSPELSERKLIIALSEYCSSVERAGLEELDAAKSLDAPAKVLSSAGAVFFFFFGGLGLTNQGC